MARTTIWPELAIVGVTPDTALILIVSYGMLRGDIEGALFGLAMGFMTDLFGGTVFGFYALLGFAAGYISGKPFRSFFKDNYFLPFLIVLLMVLAYQLLVYVTHLMIGDGVGFWFYLHAMMLPKTVYTVALAIPFYTLFHFCNARLEAFERRTLFEEKNDD